MRIAHLSLTATMFTLAFLAASPSAAILISVTWDAEVDQLPPEGSGVSWVDHWVSST